MSGIKQVKWSQKFEKIFNEIVVNNKINSIYINTNEHGRNTNKVETQYKRFINFITKNYTELSQIKSADIINELRTIKSNIEVQLVKKACEITRKGFLQILKFIKPGVKEYEIEAEFISCFFPSTL